MALRSVGQAAFLSGELASLAAKFKPRSLALFGAAGGNGLERPALKPLGRVVALDINPKYLEVCSRRHAKRFASFLPVAHDLNRGAPKFEPVDLIFAGLILEYLRWNEVIGMLPTLLTARGIFACAIQLRTRGVPEISPSPYVRLKELRDSFSFVDPRGLKVCLSHAGFLRLEARKVTLRSGKSFQIVVYQLGS